jgi:Predicted phosphohydrolases
MDRRDFLKGAAAAAVTVGTSDLASAAEHISSLDDDETKPLLASAPMLQNFAETSVGVAFAVNGLANGYVLIGEQPDLRDARKILCGGCRMSDIDDRVIQVRITGLKPATKYWYRIGADRIHYGGGYDMKVIGNEEDPRTYTFTTAGKDLKGSFCVINDTHVRWNTIRAELDKIEALAPSCVIWNGDASNTEEELENLVSIYLDHPLDRKDYAACTPYLFCPGNHDFRGRANRHLERVWMYRQPEERSPRDWDLGRNFAVRLGDIALVGLDTAEDKLDTNPRFAGLFKSGPYREAQTAWLRDALARPEITSAPFLVSCCHIPLFDDDPSHNPGDVFPADSDPRYSADFAYWQRTCAKMWGPLLHEAGCQLLITAHMHKYRFDHPASDRCWAQLVGGGHTMQEGDSFPTVIEGKVLGGRLRMTVHNIFSGQVQNVFEFNPRQI